MLSWKIGFEIELLAPPGRTRADLAERVAARRGGTVKQFFHRQAEPSKAPGHPVFENLTPGFEVVDASGARVAAFVDDFTLQRDLEKAAPPRQGWHRIVADDARLLSLVERHCDPSAPLEHVLEPLAALFGTAMQRHPSGMVRVVDDRGASVAIGAPLPGERERPCEIVTAPIEREHARVLGDLLADAAALGFSAPLEGATHLHFDAAPLCAAPSLSTLVEVLSAQGETLKAMLGTNPHCVRLGCWPAALAELTRSDRFLALNWDQARAALGELGLSKYCDFNLLNIASANSSKHTFEVRILPTHLTAQPIIEAAILFEALLRWCSGAVGAAAAVPKRLAVLIQSLPLDEARRGSWEARAQAIEGSGETL